MATEELVVTTKSPRLTIDEHKQNLLDLLAKLGLNSHYLNAQAAQAEQLLSEGHNTLDRSISDEGEPI